MFTTVTHFVFPSDVCRSSVVLLSVIFLNAFLLVCSLFVYLSQRAFLYVYVSGSTYVYLYAILTIRREIITVRGKSYVSRLPKY